MQFAGTYQGSSGSKGGRDHVHVRTCQEELTSPALHFTSHIRPSAATFAKLTSAKVLHLHQTQPCSICLDLADKLFATLAMDDIAFNRDIGNIPTSQAAPKDMFSDDLTALKMRLQSMEDSLNRIQTSHTQREVSVPAAWNLPSLPSALPSGSLFWELFTSLRTDVRGLEERVTDGEQNFSNLEDRVDSLDPSRFTPVGSNNTTRTSAPWTSFSNATSSGQLAAELPCYYQYQSCYPSWYPNHVLQPANNLAPTGQYEVGTEAPASAETVASVAFRDREIVS